MDTSQNGSHGRFAGNSLSMTHLAITWQLIVLAGDSSLTKWHCVSISNTLEGAVRQLGMRLNGPGMRWSPARAEHVLQLRCIVINGMWDQFEDYVARHAHDVGLHASRPEGLGSTPNARRKKAA